MKTILIFVKGELIRQISYKTKKEAKGNYSIFIKYGYVDYMGEKIKDATFELL